MRCLSETLSPFQQSSQRPMVRIVHSGVPKLRYQATYTRFANQVKICVPPTEKVKRQKAQVRSRKRKIIYLERGVGIFSSLHSLWKRRWRYFLTQVQWKELQDMTYAPNNILGEKKMLAYCIFLKWPEWYALSEHVWLEASLRQGGSPL